MGRDLLLERDRELASLDELIAHAAAGRAQLALVEGPAGIGKSRLLAELRARGQAGGLRTLAARGSELEREFPFGIVRQLFEPLVAQTGEAKRLLAGAAAPARAVFDPLGPAGEEAGDVSFAALHGLYWLAVNVAGDGPVVIVIDDLQWCDRPSLRFAAYLARRVEGLAMLFATGLRTGEPLADADAALIAEIEHDPMTRVIRPGPLSGEAVGGLLHEQLGVDADDAFAAACHEATGGNPLLLRQLVTALDGEGVRPDAANVGVVRDIGPRAVSRSVLLRLVRLPVHAVAVAQAVAVLGEGAELPAIAALADLDEARVAEAVGALARVEILRSGAPLGFVHPLVRDAVYHELPAAERELRHARAAQVLRAAGATGDGVAAHLLLAPRRGEPWVADLLQEAGRAAVRKGGADNAVAYLRRALQEPPAPDRRTQLLLELGLTEALTHGPAAVDHLREAHEHLQDPVARSLAASALERALLFSRSPAEAAAVARRAAAELPPELADLRQAHEALALFAVWFGGGPPELLEGAERYRTERAGDGPGAKMLAAVAAFDWMARGGSAEDCASLALEALEGGTLVAADNGVIPISPTIVLTLADREEAMHTWEAALADAHGRGSLFALPAVRLWQGFTLLRRGDLEDAEEALALAARGFETWGYLEEALLYTYGFTAEVRLGRGDVAGARTALGRAGASPGATNAGRFWRRSSLEVLLAEGRNREALAAADEYGRAVGPLPSPAVSPWRSLKAQALDRLDQTDEAVALAEEELELARHWGAPGTVGRVLRILGTLLRDDGVPTLREAVEVLERSAARLELAHALAALGSALRRSRRPTEAREPLRRALDVAASCGATGLADEIRSELHATGARPRREALSGVESLTASERRVAGLAADGQTNRDIAQTLYVTPKTVEVHLTNAYRKLGIRSRRELAGMLAAA